MKPQNEIYEDCTQKNNHRVNNITIFFLSSYNRPIVFNEHVVS